MGDIADDVIDGSACSGCGQYFQDPKNKDAIYTHGYPVLCKDCWKEWTPKERKQSGLQKAVVDTL